MRVISSDDRRFAPHYRKKAIEDAEEVRSELRKIVSLSSLSVYRLRSGDTQDFRDRQINQTPVDYRLNQLLQNLTRFQLELSQKARDVALELQREVLASILYNKETIESYKPEALFQFNKETERSRLISAYNQLNAMTSKIRRKIDIHVDAIDKTVNELKTANAGRIDFSALEALRRSQQIIKLSLDSEFKTSLIYEPVDKFIEILSEFIPDKKFSFNGGQLEVSNTYDGLNYDSLSSGEKQLLILLIETLLQKCQPYVFLTDEPELSLHIAWQRQIIPAILRLNPNAQVIAATHSPEVASKYKSSILNMENIINA
ncbi:AAA family ATPase [Aeromonas veronii]|uniref:AAA family ATPase n=1 Tax=Aeromonas veronii TaxID=654 RepID=UPI001F274867|nr:AAA family ATPase [Aeromonas veronii]